MSCRAKHEIHIAIGVIRIALTHIVTVIEKIAESMMMIEILEIAHMKTGATVAILKIQNKGIDFRNNPPAGQSSAHREGRSVCTLPRHHCVSAFRNAVNEQADAQLLADRKRPRPDTAHGEVGFGH